MQKTIKINILFSRWELNMGYSESEIKGIECVACGEKFRWPDLPNDNRLSFFRGICKCPNCNTVVKLSMARLNLMPFICFEMVFFPLFLISLDSWPLLVTVIIGAVNMAGVFYFKRNSYANEYIQTIRYDA